MEAVVYTHARNNLRGLINKVCDDYDTYMITTKENKTAVLVSYEEYSAMQETLYLMRSRKNRERLTEAIDQIEREAYTLHEIEV